MSPRLPSYWAVLSVLTMSCAGSSSDDKGEASSSDSGSAMAGCPHLTLSKEALSFIDTPIGAAVTETLVVTNNCAGDVSLEVSLAWGDDPGPFEAELPEPTSLEPQSILIFDVTFTAADYDLAEASLEISTNDVDATVPLTGQADPDQDGDGYEAEAVGGEDCDDDNADAYPKDEEQFEDGVDDDCDGQVDEGYVAAGDVLISELMLSPGAVDAQVGTWIELYNTSDTDLELQGWVLADDTGQSVEIGASLVVQSGGFVVLGPSADTTENGGAPVDHAWGTDTFSPPGTGTLSITVGDAAIWAVDIDETWSAIEGRAWSVDPTLLDADHASSPDAWCASSESFGDGDDGTPGDTNPWCDTVDHDGDGRTVADGDCDDTNDAVSDELSEVWDGLDNDCDEAIDQVQPDGASAWLAGASYDFLGWAHGLSTGDFDGDGVVDLMVGGGWVGSAGYQAGGAYLLDQSAWSSTSNQMESEAVASWVASSDYNLMGTMGQLAGDVDGDGVADLWLAGSDQYAHEVWAGDPVSGALFLGGSLSGSYDTDDAWVTLVGDDSTQANRALATHLDVDADGMADLIYGDWAADTDTAGSRGLVHLVLGGGLTQGDEVDLELDADVTWMGAQSDYQLGSAVGGGDLDGDGYPEVILGGPQASINYDEGGAIFIVDGATAADSGGSITDVYTARLRAHDDELHLGQNGTPQVGDLDGDGLADLVVSAPAVGDVLVYYEAGDLDGAYSTTDANVTISSDADALYFGWSLGLGDFDGDGGTDLVVGAPDSATANDVDELTQAGEAWIFRGMSLGSGATSTDYAGFSVRSDQLDGLGATLTWGDYDGDGADELVVAAPAYGATSELGRVVLVDPN